MRHLLMLLTAIARQPNLGLANLGLASLGLASLGLASLGMAQERATLAPTDSLLGVAGVPSIELPTAYGKRANFRQLVDGKIAVVTVLGVECPLAKLYAKRLADLAQQYADQPVAFIGVNANRQDSLTELATFKRRHEVTFPLLKDNEAQLVNWLAAERTPETFLIDATGQLKYRGRIDDQYDVGVVRDAPNEPFLRNALDAVLAGKRVATPTTKAVGCVIGRRRAPDADSPVTYSDQVARVLQKHCVECHREGEIAPFALTDYDEVVGWADTIAEVVRDQRMPPWHADPSVGHYQGERLMSAEEKQILYDWVQHGAPEGDPAKLPQPRQYIAGWRLPREPDLVVPMRTVPYTVPAEGVIEYQYFAVDPKLEEDTWIQAADIVPGERSVVHHVIVFVSPPAGQQRRGLGWLTGYVPGQGATELPVGQARLVPAGSKFIFQMHYTPTGAEEQDLTKLGLIFADPQTVQEEVVTQYAVNGRFEIPPMAGDYRVDARSQRFPTGGRLLGMAAHMHFRGKAFKFTGVWPDGRRQVLLDIPRYDFNWQHNYRLLESIATEPGFRVECEGRFDNSPNNPANPDPTIAVRWGDQTFEEMMLGLFEVAVPVGTQFETSTGEGVAPRAVQRAERTAEKLLARFDKNGNQRLERGEMPKEFALFAFSRYDHNGDRVISEDELFEAALARMR